jgi:atypical dual specificity phosphatase
MAVENFSWFVAGKIAASGRPHFDDDFGWLRKQGICAIVSLTERSLQQEKSVRHKVNDFVYRHIPIRDETAPIPAQIDAFIAFVEEMIAQDKPVLVHCAGGYGRTGTMLACYLVSQGWRADDAIREVCARRPGSIAAKVQEECVRAYGRR